MLILNCILTVTIIRDVIKFKVKIIKNKEVNMKDKAKKSLVTCAIATCLITAGAGATKAVATNKELQQTSVQTYLQEKNLSSPSIEEISFVKENINKNVVDNETKTKDKTASLQDKVKAYSALAAAFSLASLASIGAVNAIDRIIEQFER